jgi:RimJ/RimL family protein N-acetyltransferase
MEITLRPLSQDDVKTLEAWTARERVAPYMSRWTPRTASGWHCSLDLCRWHVIVVDDRSVGTVWIEREHADERVADLGILIGEPDDRAHGFGSTAIRIAERDAVESWGIGQVRLRVRVSNRTAIRCYERSGFLPVNKTTKEVDGVVFEVVHMVHDLESLGMAEGEQVVAPNGSLAFHSQPSLYPSAPVGGL